MRGLFGRTQVTSCICMLSLIAVFEYALHVGSLPTWPVFLTLVGYFAEEQRSERIPHVIVGAMFGIINSWVIANLWLPNMEFLGRFNAQVIYVLIVVACIGLFQPAAPWLLNSFTFMFFLVASLGAGGGHHWIWLVEVPTAGLSIVMGCVGIKKLVAATCAPRENGMASRQE